MKAFVQRGIYVGVGLIGGIAIAAHTAQAARPSDSAQPCSEGTVNASTLQGKTVLNPLTGVQVMAQHLYFHKEGNPVLKSSQVFAVIHITIRNGGRKPYSYSATDFRLHGRNDLIDYFDGDTDELAGPGLSAGVLPPGEGVAGDVSYVVPAAQQGYSLHWEYDLSKPYLVVPINR